MIYLPNIFVSAVGDEIEGWKVAVYSQQVQTQQHDQNLNDDPHEGSAGTQSKNLWTESLHKVKQAVTKCSWHKQTYCVIT